ncbi:MAG: hypothetical protein FWD76_01190 [Firmicutes bacterium]|nr:hypothetical protein [Bacillota bacterium]
MQSIREANTLDEVRVFREELHKARVQNEDNSLKLLGDLYKDDTHFVYELLQNAEDAGATELLFGLYEDRLELCHNGKPFVLEDVKAITNYGASEKLAEEKIGKFGIGFKSVFSVTDLPKIYSGQFAFAIENFSVPKAIPGIQNGNKTVFVFSFLKNKDCYGILKERFASLEKETLLFLRGVQKVSVKVYQGQALDSSKSFHIEKQRKEEQLTLKKTGLSGGVQQAKFLYYAKNSVVRPNFEISLAFGLDNQGKIVAVSGQKLSVFFPTEIETGLNFWVNAPFETKPTREQLKQKSVLNDQLMGELVALYGEALAHIAQKGWMTLSFLESLPTRTSQHASAPLHKFLEYLGGNVYYNAFWKATYQAIQRVALVPQFGGGVGLAKELAIAVDSDLYKLAGNGVVQTVLHKAGFVVEELGLGSSANLLKYLHQEHGMALVGVGDFVKNLSLQFLQQQSTDWLKTLYGICLGYPGVMSVECRQVPMIRTQSGKQVAFEGKGVPSVYLPSAMIEADRQVASVFMADAKSVQFFEKMGITETDMVESAVTNILPKVMASVGSVPFDKKEYLQGMVLLLGVYKQVCDNPGKVDTLKAACSDKKMIAKQGGGFAMPGECVLGTVQNKELYKGVAGVLTATIFEEMGDPVWQSLLVALGVAERFVVQSFAQDLQTTKQALMRVAPESRLAQNIVCQNHRLLYLDAFANNNTHQKSKILFEHLAKSDDLTCLAKSVCVYTLGGAEKTTVLGVAEFVQGINDFAFVLKDGKKATVGQYNKSDFVANMGLEENLCKGELLEHLGFKVDIVVKMGDEDKQRLDIAKALPVDVLQDIIKTYQDNDGILQPNIVIDNVEGLDEDSKKRLALVKGLQMDKLQAFLDAYNKNGGVVPAAAPPKPAYVPPPVNLERPGVVLSNEFGDKDAVVPMEDSQQAVQVVMERLQQKLAHQPNLMVQKALGRACDIEIREGNKIRGFVSVKTRQDKTEGVQISLGAWDMAKNAHFGLLQDPTFTLCLLTTQGGQTILDFVGNPYTMWYKGRAKAGAVDLSFV